jgi:CHAT domain
LRSGLADAGEIRSQVPLPETADELCAVARDLRVTDKDIWLGNRATEAEIKRLSEAGDLAKYRIIHFATHGALAGQVGGNSEPGLILTPPQTATVGDDGYLSALSTAEITGNPAIAAAAAEIHVLINSKPQSPTKAEIAAIIVKAMPAPDFGTPKLRAEWDALVAELRVAERKVDAADAASAGQQADAIKVTEREEIAVRRRVEACARRVIKEPARTQAEMLLHATAMCWLFGYDCTTPDRR